ncbi:DUF4384 domain-containing protein [Deinococcus sp. DB0503]|uniref:DUF4384 domain-containing protein n=1 Tax=Deinococcus sp. DB0503 TaxID=2479203 RepID=UPI0018DFC0C8|nr:DUF4384 domain-containing protein [Deinococcus sp. DB0503]MBI0446107.1 DUF4384 domain-containing protein [Deinococcus sp. DB0503]
MNAFLSVTALGLLLASTAGAAPKISAQSIIVNPVPTSLSVKVWTDRGSGNQVPNYAPGDHIRLYTSVNQDAYVYLFNVDPQGKVDLILPNRYQNGGNFLKANTTRAFPSPGDPFTFTIAAPYGLNKVLALASRTPLNLDQIASFKSQNSFATVNVQGQQQLAQALSIVVNPVEQSSWISGTAFYNVVPRSGSAAPLQTPVPAPLSAAAPQRGTPIQPAPTARALSVTVQPLPNVPDWTTTLDGGSLSSLYADYAARLRAEGYTQTSSRQTGNHIRGEFRRGDSRATLEVKQKGKRFEVKLTRR